MAASLRSMSSSFHISPKKSYDRLMLWESSLAFKSQSRIHCELTCWSFFWVWFYFWTCQI